MIRLLCGCAVSQNNINPWDKILHMEGPMEVVSSYLSPGVRSYIILSHVGKIDNLPLSIIDDVWQYNQPELDAHLGDINVFGLNFTPMPQYMKCVSAFRRVIAGHLISPPLRPFLPEKLRSLYSAYFYSTGQINRFSFHWQKFKSEFRSDICQVKPFIEVTQIGSGSKAGRFGNWRKQFIYHYASNELYEFLPWRRNSYLWFPEQRAVVLVHDQTGMTGIDVYRAGGDYIRVPIEILEPYQQLYETVRISKDGKYVLVKARQDRVVKVPLDYTENRVVYLEQRDALREWISGTSNGSTRLNRVFSLVISLAGLFALIAMSSKNFN